MARKKVDVKRIKFKKGAGKKKGKKSGRFEGWSVPSITNNRGASTGRQRGGMEVVENFENLGITVEIKGRKIILRRKDGRKEEFNDINELRVATKKGVKKRQEPMPKPNAVFVERDGIRYYHFPMLGMTVKCCLPEWKAEVQPPEHMFGVADNSEFAEVLRNLINSGYVNERAERIYREYREKKWKRDLQRAYNKAIRIYAKQNGYDLPPKNSPISYGLIEELRESGFDVKIKA